MKGEVISRWPIIREPYSLSKQGQRGPITFSRRVKMEFTLTWDRKQEIKRHFRMEQQAKVVKEFFRDMQPKMAKF